jgi:intraflagellar transport protein 74
VDRLEGKLRSLHTGIYSMREFVRAKESENNYKVLAHGLQQLAEEVNAGLRRALI